MKFLVATLLTALLSFIASLWFDWWIIAIVSFLVAILIPQALWKAFLSGFIALFLLWAGLSLWIDIRNQGILSGKIAELLPLGGNSVLLLIIIGFIGGIVAGFAAMSGSSLRKRRVMAQ
jgi:hypothetical protein